MELQSAVSGNVKVDRSPLEDRVDRIYELVHRLPHFIRRIEATSDRISGPQPQPAPEPGSDHASPGSIYAKLDVLTADLEAHLTALAMATDRLDSTA